ncbi:hypothetical protein, partial [Klebsiella pneumoniae]|uniref:hypothetical protein n=1 Tax=Klebsiella pneumoniae TaxID=573 RepID=UPI001F4A2D8E
PPSSPTGLSPWAKVSSVQLTIFLTHASQFLLRLQSVSFLKIIRPSIYITQEIAVYIKKVESF